MSCGQPCWTCGKPIPAERHRLNAMRRVFCSDACAEGMTAAGSLDEPKHPEPDSAG